MKTLKNEMKKLNEWVESLCQSINDAADLHHEVCEQTANEFDLWEPTEDGKGERFPLWLSYVVSGVLRELNIDN